MAETASGAVSLPLENGRTLLAGSARFRTLVGAADAAAAKAYIHIAPVAGATWQRPRALITHSGLDHELVARGLGNGFAEEGELTIVIEADISEAYRDEGQEENAYLEFTNALGAIITEMRTLAGTQTYLDAQAFGVPVITRGDEEEESKDTFWYRGVITLTWRG
ncbi:MAG: hypothetical protein ACYS9X_31995 [Planctomycetota bacterium]